MLETTKLTRTSVDGQTLIDQVSLSIKANDRVTLTGPSGSGKTVLLRSLAMLDPVVSGTVAWQQSPVADKDVPIYRSRVMYLHQQPTAKEGSVESVLRQPFELNVHRGKHFDRERVVGWLESVGKSESFLAQEQSDLSGGESQIAALLRAIQLDPHVLLLDEPTSALDAIAVEKLESLIENWVTATDNRAFVWVTHDPKQAQRVRNRSFRIAAGKVEVS